jgi:hypothetical protein
MDLHSPRPQQLPWLTPRNLFFGLCGLGLLVVLVGTCSVYSWDEDSLPPPTAPPVKPHKPAVLTLRYIDEYYAGVVKVDLKQCGIAAGFKPKAMRRPFAYFSEFTGAQVLEVGGKLETAHLSLGAELRKLWVGEAGRGFRAQHLVLSITNKTEHFLAYRVDTTVSCKYESKGILPHNALALRPGQTVVRTECLPGRSRSLTVNRVEVMRINELAYHYISRLDPERLQYDTRTSEGHQTTKLQPCRLLPWRAIKQALAHGGAQWRDVIDFYARHNCDEYTFFSDYRWKPKGPDKLPVKPPGAAK